MIKSHAKTGAEMRQASSWSLPFVGPNEPFVGHRTPPIRPFIQENRPFVCIRRQFGFTLVELIVTVVLAAILLSLAAPNLSSFIQRDRLGTQANDLVADLAYARSEAIKRGVNIIVCKSNDPTAADPSCNGNAVDPWTQGRVIFFDDPPGAGNNDPDPAEVLRVRAELDGTANGNRLHGDGDANGTGTRIVFSGIGMANPPASTTQFVLCDNRGPSQALAVAIGRSGRPRVTDRGKDKDGNALTAADCP